MRTRLGLWALVPAAALAYPLSTLAGGTPRFPDRGDCVRSAKAGTELEAVFGRFGRRDGADALLVRVQRLGFASAQIEGDGCGLLQVAVHGIPTLAVGRSFVAEARHVGLRPRLETSVP